MTVIYFFGVFLILIREYRKVKGFFWRGVDKIRYPTKQLKMDVLSQN